MPIPYRVLARKYRPQRFDDLVGQEVLVRTLSNAFSSGRIAHAFLLTGIRGIGKTTTARIIARGLNCIGPDGNGGPTTSPCGECPNCKMILDERHVDIIEMDAASRTGVDDIREIIDTVHYAPTSARYKVYIIDEVHMLSKNAFNALLKTLEEPPPHVIFIFATTELRKIPVTIVSRCQRFDLRRLDIDMLAGHLANVCAQENVQADAESLKLIAAAAEGSVRDGLSLLDQAIALHTDASGNTKIETEATRAMLGMADAGQSLKLLAQLFSGEAALAVETIRAMHERGGDPLLIVQDLLALTHYLTRIKLAPNLASDLRYTDQVQASAKELAIALDMSVLGRAWQLLLKGISEIKMAPQPLAAAEMLLVRFAYHSNLPSPEELIRKLDKQGASAPAAAQAAPAPAPRPAPVATATRGNLALAVKHEPIAHAVAQPEPEPIEQPEDFAAVAALFQKHREAILYSHLYNDMRLVSFKPGLIVLHPIGHTPSDVAARIARHLSDWTGTPWRINYADENGGPTLREQAFAAREKKFDYARAHPSVQTIQSVFPGAEVIDVIEE
jgi:DNA polymerase-3 subunit gamma/tau